MHKVGRKRSVHGHWMGMAGSRGRERGMELLAANHIGWNADNDGEEKQIRDSQGDLENARQSNQDSLALHVDCSRKS